MVRRLPAEPVQAHAGGHVLGDRDGGQRHDRLRVVVAVHVDVADDRAHGVERAERRPVALREARHGALVDERDRVALGGVAAGERSDLGEVGVQRGHVVLHHARGDGVDALLEAVGHVGERLAAAQLGAGAAHVVGDVVERLPSSSWSGSSSSRALSMTSPAVRSARKTLISMSVT